MKQSSLAVVAAALGVVTGCVSSSQARSVKPSRFLGDSALLLKKGGKDDVLMVYGNPDAKWTSYDKIILDPTTIWGADSSTLPPDALADSQRLVDQFHRTLADKLSKDYRLTNAAAAGAMRIQIAIINGERANAPLKVAKTVASLRRICRHALDVRDG